MTCTTLVASDRECAQKSKTRVSYSEPEAKTASDQRPSKSLIS